MKNSKEIQANVITSILLQVAAVINSFIFSKVIITTFGSEINGLNSSVKQFLNCISLIEGGIGAVILASLYSPYYNNDKQKINEIYSASKHFFMQIIGIFIIYSLLIAIIYPMTVNTTLDKKFVSALIIIISLSLIIQYYLFISDKLLLTAANKIYIVNLAMSCAFVLNSILTLALSKTHNIFIVQVGSCLAFLIQPIIYHTYSKKYFSPKRLKKFDKNILEQRWDGFHQNLAYFINSNTDVIILTFFSLKEVSVYSVYLLVINGTKSIILAISNSFQALIGKSVNIDNNRELNKKFDIYKRMIQFISTVAFGTIILIIRWFVINYVKNVNDANYNRLLFSIIISLAYYIICFREPYNLLINSANHFKQTIKGAVIEATINVCLSIALVINYGIIGVAIGTLVASIYRLVYFTRYLKFNIIKYDFKKDIKNDISYLIVIIFDCVTSTITSSYIPQNWLIFVLMSCLMLILNALLTIIATLLADRKQFIADIAYIKKYIRNK